METVELIPIVIAGPSGAEKLKSEFIGSFGFSVSHTTRKPRAGEVDGVNYHFTTVEAIEKDIANGLFIESANVHGNYYGTSKKALQDVLDKGKICLLEIDVQGCESVKRANIPCKFIFIYPPSLEILETRIRGRGSETEETIKKRLETAKKEMTYLDIDGFFDEAIENDTLETAYEKLKSIVMPYINVQKNIAKKI
ncbi:guanylate kinase [Heterostelium album PN500]|uniref:guanylate kinase n=1 Tax=Heterostelium pallidum (strain ATCC 26659 / Pp 5 / PN500) TaxID=670386 RepID=D3BEZ0_HETP5|nr:guanylate kinase [Heterostelium album PN500]EFA80471.1 guanylate kinase [Heterostelium album PN500]|eukprot:XP_020432591.1 guanylate kinase [Heterostelium album PN500]